MNVAQVADLLKAGFSPAFIEKLADEPKQETKTEPKQETKTEPKTPNDEWGASLKSLTDEIKSLIATVQASNIRTNSMGEPQSNADLTRSFLDNIINGVHAEGKEDK